MAEPAAGARRTFGPVVATGTAAAALVAVAATRAWAAPSGDLSATAYAPTLAAVGEVPPASALSLVLLAAWGVLLVTRGRARRLVAALAGLVAAALLGVVVWAATALPPDVAAALRSVGAGSVAVRLTGWFWAAGAGVLVALVTAAAAARLAPAWPEMGERYDAPAGPTPAGSPASERSSLEWWKAIDEGRDPTVE